MSGIIRDERGRIARGSAGLPNSGRKKGIRQRWADDFLQDFSDCWNEHGADALKKMATDDPNAFVRAAVALVPRQDTLDIDTQGIVTMSFIGYEESEGVTQGNDGFMYSIIDGEAVRIPDDYNALTDGPLNPAGALHDPNETEIEQSENVQHLVEYQAPAVEEEPQLTTEEDRLRESMERAHRARQSDFDVHR